MRRRLNIGFLAITLLLTGICVHEVLNSLALQETLTNQQRNVIPSALTMSEMKHHAAEIRMWTMTYIIRGNVTRGGKTAREWLQEEWTALETHASEHIEHCHEVFPNGRATAEMILDLSRRLIVVSSNLVDRKDQGASNDKLFDDITESFGPTLFYPLREILDEHAAVHLAELKAVNTAMGNRQRANVKRTIALGLTGIIIAVLVGLYTDRLFVQFLAKRREVEKALHESEAKYRDLVEKAGVGIFVNDSDGNLVYFNEAFAELFGYPFEELRELTFDALVHPDFSREGLTVYTNLREGKETTSHYEFTGIKKDGSTVFLEVDVVALKEGNGSRRWRSYAMDITERKRVEERATHIKQVLLAIRNVSQLIIAETNPKRLIEQVCENLTETMGYHSAWIALMDNKGETVTSTAASGFGDGFEVMLERLGRGEFSACMRRTLGQEALVVVQDPPTECSDCPLSQEFTGCAGLTRRMAHGNHIYGILCVSVPAAYAYDVEEQDLFIEVAEDLAFALRKIKEAQALHLATNIIDDSPAVAFVLENAKGWPVRYASENVERLFGFTARDFVSGAVPYADVVHPDDLERVTREMASSSANRTVDTVVHTPYRIVTQSGDVKWVEDMTTIQRAEDGHLESYRGILLDITERKRSEEALEEARQKEAWQQVQLMHADRLTTVGRLAAGVAHEINNPLAVLYGTIQRIKNGPILADIADREAVDRMLRVSRRIRDIVSNLLTFAREKATEKTPNDINKLLSETLTLVSSHIVKSGVEHTLKLSESVPVVCVDQQQMQQVFLNLVFNALDAMPDGGELMIATDITDDQITISFQDTGCGISPDDLGRLFVPFFTTKEVGEGTGLGLSISHGIVQEHEGKIDVKSTPGQGARFDILLPMDGVNTRG